MSEKSNTPTIQNRKARHDFQVDETFEAGLVLKGTEVKSLRQGKASFTDSFAFVQDEEVFLRELYIKPYEHGSYYNHDPIRPRKLLLNKKEIRELDKAVQQKGYTIVPLKLYFKGGKAKVLIGLAKGKKQYDKRDSIKEKDAKRQIERNVKGNYKINL
ncbi:MAG: SsrA-binding protein SmpB [Balneolaceae bacterium]